MSNGSTKAMDASPKEPAQTEKIGFYCRVNWSEYPALDPCKEQCTDCEEKEREWNDHD